jgi:hypothetical protein
VLAGVTAASLAAAVAAAWAIKNGHVPALADGAMESEAAEETDGDEE